MTRKTNAEDWIKTKWHERHWREAAERLARQSLFPLSGPVTLEQVSGAFRRHRGLDPDMVDTFFYEDWLLTLAWAGRQQEVWSVLAEARRDMAAWPEDVFESDGGRKAWFRKMEQETSDPDKLPPA